MASGATRMLTVGNPSEWSAQYDGLWMLAKSGLLPAEEQPQLRPAQREVLSKPKFHEALLGITIHNQQMTDSEARTLIVPSFVSGHPPVTDDGIGSYMANDYLHSPEIRFNRDERFRGKEAALLQDILQLSDEKLSIVSSEPIFSYIDRNFLSLQQAVHLDDEQIGILSRTNLKDPPPGNYDRHDLPLLEVVDLLRGTPDSFDPLGLYKLVSKKEGLDQASKLQIAKQIVESPHRDDIANWLAQPSRQSISIADLVAQEKLDVPTMERFIQREDSERPGPAAPKKDYMGLFREAAYAISKQALTVDEAARLSTDGAVIASHLARVVDSEGKIPAEIVADTGKPFSHHPGSDMAQKLYYDADLSVPTPSAEEARRVSYWADRIDVLTGVFSAIPIAKKIDYLQPFITEGMVTINVAMRAAKDVAYFANYYRVPLIKEARTADGADLLTNLLSFNGKVFADHKARLSQELLADRPVAKVVDEIAAYHIK